MLNRTDTIVFEPTLNGGRWHSDTIRNKRAQGKENIHFVTPINICGKRKI